MKPNVIVLNAPDHIVVTLIEIWRSASKISEMSVYGRSMEPAIPKGAVIVVHHCLDGIVMGDIIVFKNADHLTAHRVVRVSTDKEGQLFTTKGDRNHYLDRPIRASLVLGKVIEIRSPKLGTVPGESTVNTR